MIYNMTYYTPIALRRVLDQLISVVMKPPIYKVSLLSYYINILLQNKEDIHIPF